jgi:hypothetical protein
MRPNGPNQVSAVIFMHDKLSYNRPHKMLIVVDEYIRQALADHAAHTMSAADALEALYPLRITRRRPQSTRSDHGTGFTVGVFQKRLSDVGTKLIRIYPVSL